MSFVTLRPHQQDCIDELVKRPWVKREHADVTVAGGKSLILGAAAIAAAGADVNRRPTVTGRVLILAHTKELVKQDAAACKALGFEPGICCAAIEVNVFAHITVGTIQTVANRISYFENVRWIFIDEGHRIPPDEESQYAQVIAAIPGALIRGVTGSAFREGMSTLEQTLGECVYTYDFSQALGDGLVKPLRSAETGSKDIDVEGVKVSNGEYTGRELTNRAVALAPGHAKASLASLAAEGRQRTLYFACNIEHADVLAREVQQAGEPSCKAVHSGVDEGERDHWVTEFRAGRLRRLVSVAMFSTGFDVPDIDSLVLCRPIKARVLYVQSLGRGARLTPYATDCVLIDYGGNVARHGPLNMVKPIKDKATKQTDALEKLENRRENLLMTAHACHVKVQISDFHMDKIRELAEEAGEWLQTARMCCQKLLYVAHDEELLVQLNASMREAERCIINGNSYLPRHVRKVGEDLTDEAADADVLASQAAMALRANGYAAGEKIAVLTSELRKGPKWIDVTGASTYVQDYRYWLVQTEAGRAKWYSATPPSGITKAYAEYHARRGLVAHGGTMADGTLIRAN